MLCQLKLKPNLALQKIVLNSARTVRPNQTNPLDPPLQMQLSSTNHLHIAVISISFACLHVRAEQIDRLSRRTPHSISRRSRNWRKQPRSRSWGCTSECGAFAPPPETCPIPNTYSNPYFVLDNFTLTPNTNRHR